MINKEKTISTVTTVKGEIVDVKKCKLINKQYYLIGSLFKQDSGDCYIIDNRAYLPEDLVFAIIDSFGKGKYYLKDNNQIAHGVIDFANNELVYGYFKKSIRSSHVVLSSGVEKELMDISILFNRPSPFWYNFDKNKFFSAIYFRAQHPENLKKEIGNNIKHLFEYSVTSQSMAKYSVLYEKHKNLEYRTNNTSAFLKKMFINTYGFEFETSAGLIPSKFLHEIGLIPLRDGSISGLEYATIPYSGLTGISNLSKACDYLKMFTESDEKCSLHIHIGGLDRTIDTILAFLKLVVFTQDEYYMMFPLYKKYHFGYKNKSYSEPYPEHIKVLLAQPLKTKEERLEVFDKIFTYLSQGVSFKNYNNDLERVMVHPSDPEGTHKWQIRERYKIVNLIPLIFGNKKTVEFRIHTPTFDFQKIFLYLASVDALVVVANKMADSILRDNNMILNQKNILISLMHYKHQILETSPSSSSEQHNNDLISEVSYYFRERKNFIAYTHRTEQNFPKEDSFDLSPIRVGTVALRFKNAINLKENQIEDFEEEKDPFIEELKKLNTIGIEAHIEELEYKRKGAYMGSIGKSPVVEGKTYHMQQYPVMEGTTFQGEPIDVNVVKEMAIAELEKSRASYRPQNEIYNNDGSVTVTKSGNSISYSNMGMTNHSINSNRF